METVRHLLGRVQGGGEGELTEIVGHVGLRGTWISSLAGTTELGEGTAAIPMYPSAISAH